MTRVTSTRQASGSPRTPLVAGETGHVAVVVLTGRLKQCRERQSSLHSPKPITPTRRRILALLSKVSKSEVRRTGNEDSSHRLSRRVAQRGTTLAVCDVSASPSQIYAFAEWLTTALPAGTESGSFANPTYPGCTSGQYFSVLQSDLNRIEVGLTVQRLGTLTPSPSLSLKVIVKESFLLSTVS